MTDNRITIEDVDGGITVLTEEDLAIRDAMLERWGEHEPSIEEARTETMAYERLRSCGGPW